MPIVGSTARLALDEEDDTADELAGESVRLKSTAIANLWWFFGKAAKSVGTPHNFFYFVGFQDDDRQIFVRRQKFCS